MNLADFIGQVEDTLRKIFMSFKKITEKTINLLNLQNGIMQIKIN
jgi:frataxin-like iron-binding protein CyaY